MPTEMKKKPSSRPSNGAMSACSSWRYSDSDSSTPAMNAPSDGDRPAGGGKQGGARDDQQRDGGEHLRRLRAADGAEQRPHQEAATDQDDRDRDRGARHVVPGHMVGHAVAAEQRDQRDQRDEREVLEQQHGEGVAAGGLVSRSRSASIGRTMAVDDIARPAPSTTAPGQPMPDGMRKCRERRAADRDLRGAEAEHRAPHHPQPLRPHFQADQEQQHHHAEAGDGGDRVESVTSRSPAGPMTMPASR